MHTTLQVGIIFAKAVTHRQFFRARYKYAFFTKKFLSKCCSEHLKPVVDPANVFWEGVLGEQPSMKPAKNLNLPLPEPKFPQVSMP